MRTHSESRWDSDIAPDSMRNASGRVGRPKRSELGQLVSNGRLPNEGTQMHRQDPHEFVLNLVVRRHQPAEDSIRVAREMIVRGNAVFAIAFDDQSGEPRRALIGLSQDEQGTWHSSGGSSGRPRAPQDTDLWTMWGGWGPPDGAGRAAVVGGWVADPEAFEARLTDPAGRTLEDRIENGVAIFLWTEEFNDRDAYLELLDADGRVTRSGLLFQTD